MKVRLSPIKLLYALIGVQILVGILSIFMLNIGRAIAVFGSAGLIYLGLQIIQQLASIRELLSYTSLQAAPSKAVEEITPEMSSFRERLQQRFAKRATNPSEENAEGVSVTPTVSRSRGTPTQEV